MRTNSSAGEPAVRWKVSNANGATPEASLREGARSAKTSVKLSTVPLEQPSNGPAQTLERSEIHAFRQEEGGELKLDKRPEPRWNGIWTRTKYVHAF